MTISNEQVCYSYIKVTKATLLFTVSNGSDGNKFYASVTVAM